MLHDQYDQIINDHFTFEATDDIEGVLGSLTDDAEHHVVPPASAFSTIGGRFVTTTRCSSGRSRARASRP